VDLVDAGSARVDVVDAAGHLVRRLDLRSLPPGHQEVEWDGRNDAGRTVAPGPYRAWLVAGDQRVGIRLVRVP
jgi:flagellar hook assembly protein FlgD